MNLFGTRRIAKNINYSLVFGVEDGESLSDHPFKDEVDWIRQFCTAPEAGFFLIEGNETAPVRIWHGQTNHFRAFFRCIYEDQE